MAISSNRTRRRDIAYDVARAHTHLSIFHSIKNILECGVIYGDNTAARKIIAICDAEVVRQLRIMDKALDKLEAANG